MAKQSITVELDDETIGHLASLGHPTDVLLRLARAAADVARGPDNPRRGQTDESLRIERHNADVAIANQRETVEAAADTVVRIARQRADHLVQTARDEADSERGSRSSAAEASSELARSRADGLVEGERVQADAVLERERADRKSDPAEFLAVERNATNKSLTGERAHADSLVVDQREANEQLVRATIRAQELAEEAEDAKERAVESERELRSVAEFRELFIGILGHDLRNPLGTISTAAGLLLGRGSLDEQQQRTVARIVNSVQRMARMITQLLDLTRARLGGGLLLETKDTDLRDICQLVVEEFEATVQLELEGDLSGTWDSDRLTEVLSNLAGNAIEHAAPATGVVVKAYSERAEVVVEVANRGEPVPADLLPFIFEPFRRARGRAKSKSGNLGLGLYIAKQIVISHGGTLEVYCADGTTTFVMRLPRRVQ